MAQSSNWLNSVVANPWFGIIGLIIDVLGVILSVVFYGSSRIIPYNRFTVLVLLVILLIMCILSIVWLIDIIYSSKYYIVSKPKCFKDFETKSWID
jgi:hypothetical protein